MGDRPGTFFDSAGVRHYRHPTNPTISWIGVSALIGARYLPWLEKAKRRGIAEYAARHRADLATYSRATDVVAKLMDETIVLPEWERKRQDGTDAHEAVDLLVHATMGGEEYPTDHLPDGDPRKWASVHWADFLATTGFRPIDTERTVVNQRYGYAGSYDLYGELPGGSRCLVDVKTNANGPKPEVGLQLEFYDRADSIIDMSTGDLVSMHPVDRHYVLWIRPEGWAWVPVLSGDAVWRECFARMMTYHFNIGPDIIGPPEAGNLEIPKGWF